MERGLSEFLQGPPQFVSDVDASISCWSHSESPAIPCVKPGESTYFGVGKLSRPIDRKRRTIHGYDNRGINFEVSKRPMP
jgi:hypothetical protein